MMRSDPEIILLFHLINYFCDKIWMAMYQR